MRKLLPHPEHNLYSERVCKHKIVGRREEEKEEEGDEWRREREGNRALTRSNFNFEKVIRGCAF